MKIICFLNNYMRSGIVKNGKSIKTGLQNFDIAKKKM